MCNCLDQNDKNITLRVKRIKTQEMFIVIKIMMVIVMMAITVIILKIWNHKIDLPNR